MLKLNYFLADIFILSAEKQPIKLSWRKIEWLRINRTYLSNYINSTYGLNFNLWINHLRIEEAKQLMGQTPKRSLSEIAERIGFTDLAHFSKQFKLQEGVSPSEWRKNM